ncbi:MAG: hypothetical protein ABS939_08240 [Psychrobacillus sp.]
MNNIEKDSIVVLLMDIESPTTPFFATVGNSYRVLEDVSIDPSMPSGYAVKIGRYDNAILVDRSAVVHYDDWKNIHNAVIRNAMVGATLL